MRLRDFSKAAPGHLEQIPEGVGAFVPDPLPPPKSALDLSGCCGLAEQAAMAVGGLKNLVESITSGEMLVESFLRREAIRSSTIEGTHTQLGDLLLFEVGEPVQNALDAEDARQVSQNLEAFQFGLTAIDKLPLAGRLLRETHAVLFAGANRITKRPGLYRNTSTRIGGRPLETARQQFEDARFIPPPAGRVEPAMKDLEDFVNLPEKHAHLPVLVQIALMHYQFETIHPFADGNGRIGRLAIPLLLKARGLMPKPILCLSAYMDSHRDGYEQGMLAVSLRGEWDSWISFFLRGIKEQAEDDIDRCQRIMKLRQSYLSLTSKLNVPFEVIDKLFQFPATTAPLVAKLNGTTYQPGRRCIEALEGEGVLQEVTGRKQNRIYLAQPIIDLLEKQLDQLPLPAA